MLADILINRHLGVRPVTLIGFSLGARVIFYALLELAKQKAFGIVQDVFLLGTTLSASVRAWCDVRSVVSGRLVNCYARNDWVLNYLFRATSGGVGTVAGLRPVNGVPGLENVDVTDKIAGHMSYRTFMPLILDQLGFPVVADYFDEPEVCCVSLGFYWWAMVLMFLFCFLQEPDFEGDRIVVRGEEDDKKRSWFFGRTKKAGKVDGGYVSRPPCAASFPRRASVVNGRKTSSEVNVDDELPPRVDPTSAAVPGAGANAAASMAEVEPKERESIDAQLPARAGFDFAAIKHILGGSEKEGDDKAAGKNGVVIAHHRSVPLEEDSSKLKIGNRLTSLFHRSSSSSSLAAAEAEKEEDSERRSQVNHRDDEEFGGFESAVPTPNLTFADHSGSAWGEDRLPPFSVSSPLASVSTSHLTSASDRIPPPLSRSDTLDRPASSPRVSYGIPASPITPSASTPGSHFMPSSLSFGGADGSISVSPGSGSARADSWSAPLTLDYALDGRKRTVNTGFDPNPWS